MSDHKAPPATQAFPLRGLEGDVEVLVDKWGIPHIYAGSRLDAFRAQGFQAARDRLFQIDLWRRRGLGRLAEVLGPAHVAQDRATRLFLFRGDMRAEWLAYSTDAKEIVTAFVAGVNAFVDWALDKPGERLPPEFEALGYLPSHWQPEDIVRIRTHGLLYNAEQELARALTVRDLGAEAEWFRSVRETSKPLPDIDPALYEGLDDSVLDVYRLAFAPVDFGAETAERVPAPSGSNNWAIAGALTETGRPILANDPHRSITLPSLRYLTHLVAPELNVIGAGEPQLPGISIGHNEHVAFGLTIWPADMEDLYVYELHPDDDTRYFYRGAWETFEVVAERSSVAGAEDVTHELVFTRHGPVVSMNTDARKAVAVRAAWLQPGMVPYLASLEYQDAADAAEFRRALRRWGAPAVSQVYATVDGEIGWEAACLLPYRPNWDGSIPVPGDGRFEWAGFADTDELPSEQNPSSGWFTTSNQNNVPESHDDDRLPVTRDWYTTGRHERLVEWLRSAPAHSLESSAGMQNNVDNIHGRRLLDALDAVIVREELAHEWHWLQSWDGVEDAGSREALVYQIWQRRHLRPRLVDAVLARLGVPAEAAAQGKHRLLRDDTLFSDLRPDLRMVESFDFSDDADRTLLGEIVGAALAAALAEIVDLLGEDRSGWSWGALHATTLRNPVLARFAASPQDWATLPTIPRSGSGDTVGLSGHDPTFNAVMGSSFRMVADVGGWDNTLVVNSPGQSGDPRSPHYADLLDVWASEETFRLAFSRDAVEAVTEQRIRLTAPDE